MLRTYAEMIASKLLVKDDRTHTHTHQVVDTEPKKSRKQPTHRLLSSSFLWSIFRIL